MAGELIRRKTCDSTLVTSIHALFRSHDSSMEQCSSPGINAPLPFRLCLYSCQDQSYHGTLLQITFVNLVCVVYDDLRCLDIDIISALYHCSSLKTENVQK